MWATAPKYALYEDGRRFDLRYADTGDFRFWVAEAQKGSEDTVLELACGTGGISIGLAQAGYAVTGMDLSAKMREVARQKGEDKGVRVKWIEGDLRSFTLGSRFSLALLAGSSFCHLLDRASIEGGLSAVRPHWESEGRFIVCVFVPSPALREGHRSREERFAEYSDSKAGERVTVAPPYEYEPDTQIK